MVRASTLQSVDLGLISQVESYQKTSKMVFTASLLDAQQNRDSVENKPESLLVVSLGKALNGMPPSSCGRQVAGRSSFQQTGSISITQVIVMTQSWFQFHCCSLNVWIFLSLKSCLSLFCIQNYVCLLRCHFNLPCEHCYQF